MDKQNRKIAIVTGGGSGLGMAIAKTFCKHGIFTIVIGRDRQKLDRVQQELGSNCTAVSADLSDLKAIPGMIDNIINQYGDIDILVNNAGINMKKAFTEVTDEEFQQVIQTNLCVVFALSREIVKNMLPRKQGAIVNISSMAAQYGLPKVIAYSASKTAVEGMTRAMAVELSPHGLRINCIAPGFIYSDMTARALDSDPERKQKVFSRTPMGTMGQPEDIGEAAYFLCSDEARFITGTVLRVDGGNSIGF